MLLSLWDLEQLLLMLLETRLIPVTSFESELFTCVAEISGGPVGINAPVKLGQNFSVALVVVLSSVIHHRR